MTQGSGLKKKMLRHLVSPIRVLLIVMLDLFKVSKMTNFKYDLIKVSKMTNFNYDLFKVSKINNFLWFFFMVKNCYKFSKMGFLVIFNDFSR